MGRWGASEKHFGLLPFLWLEVEPEQLIRFVCHLSLKIKCFGSNRVSGDKYRECGGGLIGILGTVAKKDTTGLLVAHINIIFCIKRTLKFHTYVATGGSGYV